MSTPDGHKQAGISLIELVMFIVIVGVAVVGVLAVMNITTKSSADPIVRKQALAIAESLLEEIELMPFTYCDPDDPKASLSTTIDSTFCTGGANGPNDENKLPLGPETAASVGGAEGRYASPRFDNVSDYNGLLMNAGSGGIKDITGAAIAGLDAYTASVAITQAGTTPFALPNADVLQIDVRVQSGDVDVTLTGYRFRYAPNSL
jgi:MSHA pilin protein MshD